MLRITAMEDPNQPPQFPPLVPQPPLIPQQQPVQQQPIVVQHVYRPVKDPGLAVILEILPGILAQTFGIGNIYAGNVTGGVLIMIGYWVLQFINFLLCFVIIGIFTLPLTWVAFMIFCPIAASNSAKRQASMVYG